ncbi:hypothetical protein NGTWS0302_28350 [Mycolicibacterium cyprinidarum]|uniref:Fibronectin-binding protein n=1 Tax=Mycolicibacterium cyprinidarum TaxID=2860311 RepID=A0ABQ4VFY0_9MYCO|nr:hypothetical protein NGTWS0302_28350 [Mycolicibacterium sp. NGTWS0302]GJF14378.1 hypothetical protein NGTWS1702_16160 [Mycolicibacterium sp. NGTWSNA01]GJF15812.1 hypothetical protein NGTWS1803_01190 [Mycolicibacterium sp. NGTWS1803]
MITMKKAVVLALGASALTLGVAAPASAQPGGNPCELALSFVCQFVPIAPDIEHDIDLTQTSGTIAGQPVPQMPSPPDTDYGPPAPICANGCI